MTKLLIHYIVPLIKSIVIPLNKFLKLSFLYILFTYAVYNLDDLSTKEVLNSETIAIYWHLPPTLNFRSKSFLFLFTIPLLFYTFLLFLFIIYLVFTTIVTPSPYPCSVKRFSGFTGREIIANWKWSVSIIALL